jgi:hypothetical protein
LRASVFTQVMESATLVKIGAGAGGLGARQSVVACAAVGANRLPRRNVEVSAVPSRIERRSDLADASPVPQPARFLRVFAARFPEKWATRLVQQGNSARNNRACEKIRG